MRQLLAVAVVLAVFNLGDAFSKYGRTCKDIGCLPTETCVMVEEPCTLTSKPSQCGKYPTCKSVSKAVGKNMKSNRAGPHARAVYSPRLYPTTRAYPTRPYPTRPYPTRVYPTRAHPTRPYPTRVHPTRLHPTHPYPTKEYPNNNGHGSLWNKFTNLFHKKQ